VRTLTRSATDTEAHGARFARAWPSEANVLAAVYLSGDLGAGKTTWVRGFLGARGITAAVRSPTYTLVELYEIGATTAVHVDLYRLQNAAELELLGVRDWAQPGYLWLIEWPERAADGLPPPDLRVVLRTCEQAHEITVEAASEVGRGWLSRVEA
jgi:tRNA threonylcarbamoyladenosine biosynthesis protein TsaE